MAWTPREVVISALLAGLTGLLLFRVAPYFEIHNVEVGDRAPDFDLTADDGSGVRLSDFRGKFVLLNFWATWCPPCVDELPSLNSLHEQLSNDGLIVLGVSVDEQQEEYQRFIERWNVRFPTVRDPEREVSSRYGTAKYPESYLIDRDGTVIRKYIGPEDWNRSEIMNYLSSLL
jgi:peroxiredoxin